MTKSHANLPAGVLANTIETLETMATRPGLSAQHSRDLRKLARKLKKYSKTNDAGGAKISLTDIADVLRAIWTTVKALGIIS